jgi:hypothetical protein
MNDRVERAALDSFPASDSPAWIRMHAGTPGVVTMATGSTVLSIVPDGERRYRITDADGHDVGQIFGRSVRLHGFKSESEVIDAARRAWRTLELISPRERYRRLPHKLGALRFVHDGASEWVSDGVIPLARIIRPRADEPDDRYGVEWLVPADAVSGVSLEAVHAIAHALQLPALSRQETYPEKPDANRRTER